MGERPSQARLDALLGRIARRDEIALADFYDVTVGYAYALARRITRDADAAEDVVSEVYLQAWRQAARYDPHRGGVLAWLLAICRSRALDYLRRRDPAEIHPAPHNLQARNVWLADGPDDFFAVFERDSRVHAALARLDEKARRLVELAYFRGLTHQEIAARAAIPLGSVKTTLRRAVVTLRERLADVAPVPNQEDRNLNNETHRNNEAQRSNHNDPRPLPDPGSEP